MPLASKHADDSQQPPLGRRVATLLCWAVLFWLISAALSAKGAPNDPFFWAQWYHDNATTPGARIRSSEAWEITKGSSNIIVAVLDSGINATLEEFAGRIVPGWNFIDGNSDTSDESGHGTAISAICAANVDNDLGIAGIDWRCKIMPIKVLDTNDFAAASWVADGINFAVSNGCKVINLSLALDGYHQGVASAITNAIARGVIVVGLTDNGAGDPISFPGNFTNIITVGASTSGDTRWSGSRFGNAIDLVAPGADVCTLNKNGDLWCVEGTSAAAPMVSASAALLASLNPTITHDQVRTLLCAGADDQVGPSSEDAPGFDPYFGHGRLNIYNSLLLAQTKFDSIQVSNNVRVLTWRATPNAGTKNPYRVEFAHSPTGPWTQLTNYSAITYADGAATWQDDGSLTGNVSTCFYRLAVVAN